MNRLDRLELELAEWFEETALRTQPDDVEDILRATAATRQRPRWTFLPLMRRPMGRPSLGWTAASSAPLRIVLLLALVGLVLVGLVMAFGANRPRLPAPFGPAANGLIAYERDGDIFTVDPRTGERRAVSVGPERDHDPRWSLDGTKLAFLRGSNPDVLMVTDRDGPVRIVTPQPLTGIDADTVAWSPDGRTIVLAEGSEGRRGIDLVDVVNGQVTFLPVDHWNLEAHWRPPNGRELMVIAGTDARIALVLYSLDHRTSTEVPGTAVVTPSREPSSIRPVGWTPDGSRFAYHKVTPAGRGFETRVIDLRTGVEIVLPLGFGRISNAGDRIVGFDRDGRRDWLCVAAATGGPCMAIQGNAAEVEQEGFASFQWAPDDRSIRIGTHAGPVALLDPNGGPVVRPPWADEGAASWQRLAP
jgi:WD40 repeat protein